MTAVSLPQRISLILASLLFFGSGTLHFLRTEAFVQIVPPYIHYPHAAVYLSGFAEIAGAAGLLIRQVRRLAAWGLVALLIAVFPANLYRAIDSGELGLKHLPVWVLWARLPLQALIIWWVLWCSKTKGAWQQISYPAAASKRL